MKTLAFAKRNFKEIIRDPISLIFCIGLPLFLLIIFQQFKIPSEVYSIQNFAPSIVIFSFGFISLFSGQLIARDRTTSFLNRLFVSPLSAFDYVIGYSICLIGIALIQSLLFFIVALFLKLTFDINLILTILALIPVSMLYIGLGVLIGCTLNDKQAPGFGSIIIQLVAFTSGMWFDISTVGVVFRTICNALPFRYTIDLARYGIQGEWNNALVPAVIIIAYIIVIFAIDVIIFKKKMRSDKI